MNPIPDTDPNQIQLNLIIPPKGTPTQKISEDLVPAKIQSACLHLLAELLEAVVNPAPKGGSNER
jgi:hypothetical protein